MPKYEKQFTETTADIDLAAYGLTSLEFASDGEFTITIVTRNPISGTEVDWPPYGDGVYYIEGGLPRGFEGVDIYSMSITLVDGTYLNVTGN